MTQHTQKPWTATGGTIQAGERTIAIAPQSAHKPNIPKGAPEVFANMRLMAAAPEMLAALEAFMHADEHFDYDGEFVRRFQKGMKLAKRALEKIE